MRYLPWIMGVSLVGLLVACGDDDEDSQGGVAGTAGSALDGGPDSMQQAGGSAGTAGSGGAAGQAGSAGAAGSGKGGSAGTAGSGTAGSAGAAVVEKFFGGKPERLAINGNVLVFTEKGAGDTDGSVKKVTLPSGTPEVLASGQASPSTVLVHDQKVYWQADDTIKSIPLAGGAEQTVVSGVYSEGFAADGSSLFWTNSSFSNAGLWSAPLTGGAASEAAPSGQSFGVATAPGKVFWADLNGASIRMVASAGGTAQDLATGQDHPEYVAVSGDFVYWSREAGDGEGVWRAPIAGGTPVQIAAEHDYVHGFAVDSNAVYYYHWNGIGGIRRVPPEGGTPTKVVSIFDMDRDPPDNVGQMSMDATHVYWIDGNHDGIYRIAR